MLISKCLHCDKEVGHSVREVPLCDEHSGRTAAREAEKARWANMTVEEKLDELKARVEMLANRPSMYDPIG